MNKCRRRIAAGRRRLVKLLRKLGVQASLRDWTRDTSKDPHPGLKSDYFD